MPPDVFLLMSLSGISLVASLMFFVSDDPEPRPNGPVTLVTFAVPPPRPLKWNEPPPATQVAIASQLSRALAAGLKAEGVQAEHVLPGDSGCSVQLAMGGMRYQVDLTFSGGEDGEWVIDLDSAPLADGPAVEVTGDDATADVRPTGRVHDLRWHGRAGIARKTRSQWRIPPGKA